MAEEKETSEAHRGDEFIIFCNDCQKQGVEFTDPGTGEMFCVRCWTGKKK